MVLIRRATTADEGALAGIGLATWNDTTSPVPAPDTLVKGYFFDERTQPADVLVAEGHGLVRGYVTLRGSDRVGPRRHVCDIAGLSVDPGSQGRGVGRKLLEAAIRACGESGARKISLKVLGTNTSARGLYERHGFVVEGVLRGEFLLGGQMVDAVLMARHFSDPQ